MIAPNPLDTRYWDQLLTPGHQNQPSWYRVWMVQHGSWTSTGTRLTNILEVWHVLLTNHNQPISISLKWGFFHCNHSFSSLSDKSTRGFSLQHSLSLTQIEVFCESSLPSLSGNLHSPANLQEGFHYNTVFPSLKLSFSAPSVFPQSTNQSRNYNKPTQALLQTFLKNRRQIMNKFYW